MRKIHFTCVILFFTTMMLSSCGVSSKKMETMQNSLEVTLNSAFLSQDDFVAFAPTIELSNVEKGESPWSPADGYHGGFSYSFTDGDKSVYLTGHVGFDKNGIVAKGYDGKYAIHISVILVDAKNIPVLQSPYNLPTFGGIVAE